MLFQELHDPNGVVLLCNFPRPRAEGFEEADDVLRPGVKKAAERLVVGEK